MKSVYILLLSLVSSVTFAHSDVFIEKDSKYSVGETVDRLEEAVKAAGMGVFARVDHEAAATKSGLTLAPSQVLIFGNPKLGTALMNCEGAIALDLPLRVAVWQDSKGQVKAAYNAPSHLKSKYHVKDCDPVFDKMTGALSNFVNKATE